MVLVKMQIPGSSIPEQLSQSFWRWELGISLRGDSAAQGA